MRFTKMHGVGNDFVVIDLRSGLQTPDAAVCARMADRHVGIGCDQLLTVEAPRGAGAVASYRIWNSDGSIAQQCGNGARCIAAWLVRDGTAPAEGGFVIDSPAATHAVARDALGGFVIDMGAPQFAPQAISLQGWDEAQNEYSIEMQAVDAALQHPLPAAARDEPGEIRFGAVSMGNPHAVIEVADVANAPVHRLGPALQRDPAFPQSVNVGFAEIVAGNHLRLRVFERGVGETLACGSGACAAVAVLMRRGRIDADREVRVDLAGGTLRIRYDQAAQRVFMGGPTAFVFEGEWQ